jgi:starch synthase (maltosyl-transferring)
VPAAAPVRVAQATGRDAVSPRVVIEAVAPEVDGGRFPLKRVVGDTVVVRADVFAEGHDRLAVVLRFRREGDPDWHEIAMGPLRTIAGRRFAVTEVGGYEMACRPGSTTSGRGARASRRNAPPAST